jgi:hypothetical protein
METRNWSKSSAGMTCVRVAPDGGFKRCCLRKGRHEGANRNYFFPGVTFPGVTMRDGGLAPILVLRVAWFGNCSSPPDSIANLVSSTTEAPAIIELN